MIKNKKTCIKKIISILSLFFIGLVFMFSNPTKKVKADFTELPASDPIKINMTHIYYDSSNYKIIGKSDTNIDITLNYMYDYPNNLFVCRSANYRLVSYVYRYVGSTTNYINNPLYITSNSTTYWSTFTTLTRSYDNILFKKFNSEQLTYDNVDYIQISAMDILTIQTEYKYLTSGTNLIYQTNPGTTYQVYIQLGFNFTNTYNSDLYINRSTGSPTSLGLSINTTVFPLLSSNSNGRMVDNYYNYQSSNFYETIYNEKYFIDIEQITQEGIDKVIDTPRNYGLYNQTQVDNIETQAYNRGLNESSDNAMNYNNIFVNLFNAVGNILNVEIFPNITLGLVIGLPLMLTLVIIILKLIRG